MNADQFQKLIDLIEAQDSHSQLLSQALIELLERERGGCEPPNLADSQEQLNNLVESLKRAQYAKTVALKFLRKT